MSVSVKQQLLDIGLNAFGLELFIESFLRSKTADAIYKRGAPTTFAFPINRSEYPQWEGVQVTLMPIAKKGGYIMTKLTDDQCEAIRRKPGSFIDMIRNTYDMGYNQALIDVKSKIKESKPYPWLICGANNHD